MEMEKEYSFQQAVLAYLNDRKERLDRPVS